MSADNVSRFAAEIAAEREALVATLRSVGPDAPTLAGDWKTQDLAAHVAATEQVRGLPTFLGRRAVVRFGWRLNDILRPIMSMDLRRFRRRGFEWALRRLERPVPALLLQRSVRPITAFEVFVHHEDVRRANDLPARRPRVGLAPSVQWLLEYQQPLLRNLRLRVELLDGGVLTGGTGPRAVTVVGSAGEVLLWLAGRPSNVTGPDGHSEVEMSV